MTDNVAAKTSDADIEALVKQNAELQHSLGEVKRQMSSRIVLAELKAEAVRAGIVDLDALRLVDLADAKVDDSHNVRGIEDMVRKLKEQKPYLFPVKSSSTAQIAPAAQPLVKKQAKDMSDEEYQAARAALLRQHR